MSTSATHRDQRTDLDRVEELFAFLQGTMPECVRVATELVPNLTAEQAWTVIWYLGNEYWQVPDNIERCDVCGELYDNDSEGLCLDFAEAPYHFCGECVDGQEWCEKLKTHPSTHPVPQPWCLFCKWFIDLG